MPTDAPVGKFVLWCSVSEGKSWDRDLGVPFVEFSFVTLLFPHDLARSHGAHAKKPWNRGPESPHEEASLPPHRMGFTRRHLWRLGEGVDGDGSVAEEARVNPCCLL